MKCEQNLKKLRYRELSKLSVPQRMTEPYIQPSTLTQEPTSTARVSNQNSIEENRNFIKQVVSQSITSICKQQVLSGSWLRYPVLLSSSHQTKPSEEGAGNTDERSVRARTGETVSTAARRASPPLPSFPTLPFPPSRPTPRAPTPRRRLRRSALSRLLPRPSFPPLLLPRPAFLSLVGFTESSRLGAVQSVSPLPRPPSSFFSTPPISSPVEDEAAAVAPAPAAAPAVAAVGVAGTGVVKERWQRQRWWLKGAAAGPAASLVLPFLFSAARKFFASVHVCA
ncbi:uncharacterized protein LOC111731501 [Pteropus vampyrus]|uniref:Uncharacterized protein LOC111731501 n=1 Tax=Pteropus vampyrus TaxID=132908 RepID=A0A6P6BUY0_PTEVA|nr:uncharacterized protein LOC111731501 [Pteropus vampyrus]